MIEQAKFIYYPLGKAFEQQTKTTEDQGRKQIEAIQNLGQVKTIKKYTYNDKDSPWFQNKNKYFINSQMKDLRK